MVDYAKGSPPQEDGKLEGVITPWAFDLRTQEMAEQGCKPCALEMQGGATVTVAGCDWRCGQHVCGGPMSLVNFVR